MDTIICLLRCTVHPRLSEPRLSEQGGSVKVFYLPIVLSMFGTHCIINVWHPLYYQCLVPIAMFGTISICFR